MSDGAFSTHVLDRVRYEERRTRETMRARALEELKLSLMESPIPIGEAFSLGSLVRPYTFDSHSDVDVVVHTMDPRDYLSLKGYLEGRLQREVDLVEMESAAAVFVPSEAQPEAITYAAMLGRDVDSIAGIVGTWVGALRGGSGLPADSELGKANTRDIRTTIHTIL